MRYRKNENTCRVPKPKQYIPNLESVAFLVFEKHAFIHTSYHIISATENTVLTREELLLNAMRIASYLRQLKLPQTDIVGIIARNTTHISAVAYACFFNGIAVHFLNVMHEEKTIESLYNITKPRLIFCDGDDYDKIRAATSSLSPQIVTMRNHKPEQTLDIFNILATPIEKDFVPARLEKGNNQTLAILCSSGTTGTFKAVTMMNNRKIFSHAEPLTTSDVQYSHNTLDWGIGILTLITSGVFSTTRIITDAHVFDPVQCLRIIGEYKVTWTFQTPSQMAMVANCDEFQNANLDSLKHYLFTGGRCSVEIQELIYKRLRGTCAFNFGYGFTELNALATMNLHFEEKTNSVGRVVNGMKMKILDDQGNVLNPDEVGEICIYSNQYWGGYYGNIEDTNKMLDQDLWLHTGDLGYVDKDGFLYIVDRKKDLLKYHSMKYFPHEIEEVISHMPEVSEVCVFGVWDAVCGDIAAASVVRKLDSKLQAQDVIDYVANHMKASYKHLHGGALIVEDLQRSPNGKTNRMATKAHFLMNSN